MQEWVLPSLAPVLGQQFPEDSRSRLSAWCAKLALGGFVGAVLGWLRVAFVGFASSLMPGTFLAGCDAWVGISPGLLTLKSSGYAFNRCSKL